MNKFIRAWYKNTAHNQKVLRELGYGWGLVQNEGAFLHPESIYLYTNTNGHFNHSSHLDTGCPKGTQVEEYLNNTNPLSKERILDAISVIKEVNGKLPSRMNFSVAPDVVIFTERRVTTTPHSDGSAMDNLVDILMTNINKDEKKAKLQKDLDDLMTKAEEIKEQIKGM